MAKTPSQWYEALIAEKNNFTQLNALQPNIDTTQTLLDDLTTQSKVAEWRLWTWVFAVGCWLFETIHERFLAETVLAASRQYGTVSWYAKVALEFQLGDPLVWLVDEQRYGYAVIDRTKQVVKKVAVIEPNHQVRLKVANFVSNAIVPLTAAELAAFDQYINDIRPAGINTAVLSRLPDTLKLQMVIHYDPLVIKANGESLKQPGVFPVEDAIVNYLTALDFGGLLVLSSLVDAIQAVTGVVNPIVTNAQARYGLIPYTSFTDSYLADAGYMKIDPAFPLNTTLTYVPVL